MTREATAAGAVLFDWAHGRASPISAASRMTDALQDSHHLLHASTSRMPASAVLTAMLAAYAEPTPRDRALAVVEALDPLFAPKAWAVFACAVDELFAEAVAAAVERAVAGSALAPFFASPAEVAT